MTLNVWAHLVFVSRIGIGVGHKCILQASHVHVVGPELYQVHIYTAADGKVEFRKSVYPTSMLQSSRPVKSDN